MPIIRGDVPGTVLGPMDFEVEHYTPATKVSKPPVRFSLSTSSTSSSDSETPLNSKMPSNPGPSTNPNPNTNTISDDAAKQLLEYSKLFGWKNPGYFNTNAPGLGSKYPFANPGAHLPANINTPAGAKEKEEAERKKKEKEHEERRNATLSRAQEKSAQIAKEKDFRPAGEQEEEEDLKAWAEWAKEKEQAKWLE